MGVPWQPKTAILLHVYDCRLPWEKWFYVMWGTPELPGRIPTAVAATLETDAEIFLVFWDKDCYVPFPDGRNEAELIRDTLFERIGELPGFSTLPILGYFTPEEIERAMRQVFRLSDVEVVNTEDEVREALSILKAENVERVVFVSSFDHMSRIVQLAGKHWGAELSTTIMFWPARALQTEGSMEEVMAEVVVFEPPTVRALGVVDPRRLFGLQNNKEAIAQVDKLFSGLGI